jgi:flagellar biosynthesis/type III secretory pathway chaperone
VELEAFNLVVLHLEQGEVQFLVKVMQEEQQMILQEQLVVAVLVQLVEQDKVKQDQKHKILP